MRLIDADELKHALEWLESDTPVYLDVMSTIDERTTVDAEPVKHGHWVHGKELSRDYVGDVCVSVHYDKCWCSECHYPVEGLPLWKYCPSCGAKMDEDEWQEPEINPCSGCGDYDGRGGCKSNGGCGKWMDEVERWLT